MPAWPVLYYTAVLGSSCYNDSQGVMAGLVLLLHKDNNTSAYGYVRLEIINRTKVINLVVR